AIRYIKAYCFAKEAEFRRVINHRVRGWSENKNTGDAFFKKQREQADSITMVNEKYFFDMMVRIAEDMHKKTGVLSPKVGATNIHVLDLCMAPGGFSDAAMRRNPRGKFFALTLPENVSTYFPMFSEIEVYKPEKIHAARSSFYLIAKNVNTKLKEFTSTLKILQEEYHEATFGGREGTGQDFSLSREEDVLALLETFGDELARLGRPIWKIQADALAKTNFAGGNLGEN
ncbi:hypothetical protein B0O99DRAFT_698290, partial [Bisporella sp. PMI_857]